VMRVEAPWIEGGGGFFGVSRPHPHGGMSR
jgi:hypothetical protein